MSVKVTNTNTKVGDCWTITFENVSQRALLNPSNVFTWGGVSGDLAALETAIDAMGGTLDVNTIYNDQGLEVGDIKNVVICLPCESFSSPPSNTLTWSFLGGSRTGIWDKKYCDDPVFDTSCWQQLFDEAGVDNTFTSFRDTNAVVTAVYEPTFDCPEENFPIDDAAANWTQQIDSISGGITSILEDSLLNSSYCTIPNTDPPVGCAGLPTPTIFLPDMKFRYAGFRICPGGKAPFKFLYRSDQRGIKAPIELDYNIERTDVIYYDRCVDKTTGDVTWFVCGEERTEVPEEDLIDGKPFCAIPCTQDFPDKPTTSPCDSGILNGCVWDADGVAVVTPGVTMVYKYCEGVAEPQVQFLINYGQSTQEEVGIAGELEDGEYFGDCLTGAPIGPEQEPPACPEGTKLDPATIQKHSVIVDNSNYDGAPSIHLTGLNTVEMELSDGTIATATGTGWLSLRDALQQLGYTVNVANANHPNGSPQSGLPDYVGNPPQSELFALGWHACKCGPELVRVEIIDYPSDANWVGATRPLTIHEGPETKIWYANICGVMYAEDCNGNPINVDACCIESGCCDKENKQAGTETFRVCWFIDGDINNCADGNVLQTFAKQVDCYINGLFDSGETTYFEVDGTTPFDPDSLAETAIAVPCRIDDEGNILICHPKCYEYTVPVIVKPIKIVKSTRTLTATIKKSLVRKVVAEKVEPDVAIQRSVAPGEEPAALEYTPGTTLRVTECCLCGSSEVVQTIYEIQQDDLTWLEVDGPFKLGADSLWVEKPCDPALDCPKEDLVDLGACTIGTLTDLIEQFKVIKGRIPGADYTGAFQWQVGRPDANAIIQFIDNRDPNNQVILCEGPRSQFIELMKAKGYFSFEEVVERHHFCPCPPGKDGAAMVPGDYFFTANGDTISKPECVPLSTLNNSTIKDALEEICALRVGLCPEDITALACAIKEKLSECPVCPELVTGFLTDVNDGSVLDLPFEALGSVQEWTQNITVDNPDCLSDEPEICITIDHEAGVGGHTGFLVIASAGTFTAKSASNSIPGFFSNPGTNIISIGHNQELGNARNLRWVKLTVSKADLIAGISIQSGTFGSTNATSFDKMHSINYEITAGKENCDGC